VQICLQKWFACQRSHLSISTDNYCVSNASIPHNSISLLCVLQVQTACCSALCTLIEVAGPDPVTPFLPQLLTYVQQAFSLYGVKSSLILVDTIGTIADIVGDALADRALVALYFPKLMEKFVELEDDDMRLFPILECLTSVVAASGLECQPYAHGLYFRCLRIIGNTMAANGIADAKVTNC
jgi:transportin-1